MKCVCGKLKMSITLPSRQEHGIESVSKESNLWCVHGEEGEVVCALWKGQFLAVSESLVEELTQTK